jgi:formate hydrogenlyase transcriptional activator
MRSAATQQAESWLVQYGPKELERTFRALICQSVAPILIADSERFYHDASCGAARLLGLPRKDIFGRSLDDFVDRSAKATLTELWQDFLRDGENSASLPFLFPATAPGATTHGAGARSLDYTLNADVWPARHLVLLRDEPDGPAIPAWEQDFALFLINPAGEVVDWYSGAERLYGYARADVVGQHATLLAPADETVASALQEELSRSARDGHAGHEAWGARKDGQRFWANALTVCLKNERGELQGYARLVRDFSQRRDRDEKLRSARGTFRLLPPDAAVAGVVSGEFDRVPEANNAFLNLLGYTRGELAAGRVIWSDLTPPEYAGLDELAREEGLMFGASRPFRKELTHKDGSRIPVLVVTAVLKLSPFRWITFVQDLRDHGPREPAIVEEPQAETNSQFTEIVGRGVALRRMLGQIELVAPTAATVLILGETGTGKELVARALHRMSPRRDKPFVTLNCAAIPTGLLESELFGYERGAFTGALTQKIGRFEMANRGTLFLDEVGDIPIELQPKLLRALQEKAFERLGGTKTIPIDVRLVAATNRDLTQMMREKSFRSDLYYRLKVFPIATPPLREHPEDIPILVRHFVGKYAAEMGRKIDTIPPETMRALLRWTWPGNVRELENFIERCVILSPGSSLHAPLAELMEEAAEAGGDNTLEHVEREHVLRVLRETDSVVSKAAQRLGMPRTTLNALMRKLGISPRNLDC